MVDLREKVVMGMLYILREPFPSKLSKLAATISGLPKGISHNCKRIFVFGLSPTLYLFQDKDDSGEISRRSRKLARDTEDWKNEP
jgi:hypothetical protein